MNLGRKILVVGANGSGKTTFADKLSRKLNKTHYELDNIYWKPDWQETDRAVFRAEIEKITLLDSWIIDGNYSRIQDLTIGRADTIIWLDVPYLTVLFRVTKRSLNRIFTQKPLWHNNRETIGKLFSKGSIILFASRTFKIKNEKYKSHINSRELPENKWIRLRSNSEHKKFWRELTA